MNAIICDKCGLIFPKDGEYHAICIDNYLALFDSRVNGDYHLCDSCLALMREWIEQEVVD